MTLLGFILLAAVGTVARALLTAGQPPQALPYRTLLANTVGAFALGLVVGTNWSVNTPIVTVALLGSFTTFSTVIGETIALVDDRRRGVAIAYLGATILLGIVAAWAGLALGEST